MVFMLMAEQDGVNRRTLREIDVARRKHVEPVATGIVTEVVAEQWIEQDGRTVCRDLPPLVAEKRHLKHVQSADRLPDARGAQARKRGTHRKEPSEI